MSQASCILIWCYGSDGGGSGDGHCGCHMCSPVKKKLVELKNKKQKRLTKGLRHVVSSLLHCWVLQW